MLFIKSLLLGVGLSMDAVAVSMANGLKNPQMKEERKLSIAFSFGFTFSQDSIPRVFLSALIIGLVTFILSYCAILVGKKFGTVYAGNADILGGIVLLAVAVLL